MIPPFNSLESARSFEFPKLLAKMAEIGGAIKRHNHAVL